MSVGAIILAAGFGTRLAPLTNDTPKPLLVVGGRPVASHLLAHLSAVAGLDQVVVVVNDCHVDQWQDWQAQQAPAPSSPPSPQPQPAPSPRWATTHIVSNGVTTNEARHGAVADLALGAKHLTADLPDVQWAVVLAGDNLLDEPLTPHLAAARVANKPVVLCRDLGDQVPAGRFGEVTIDASGQITRFREKPADPESPLAATCSYVLPRQALSALDIFLSSGGDADSPGRFVGWLASNQPVLARRITGTYHDIGNHQTLAQARAFYTHDRPDNGDNRHRDTHDRDMGSPT